MHQDPPPIPKNAPKPLADRLARHLGQHPQISPTAYVAHTAVIIGDVTIGPRASVWPTAVLRGDINSISVGEASNVQDGTIVHLADNYGVEIGRYTTVGHASMIHACKIGDECLIGMRATILDGAVVGDQSIIAAGALVTKGMEIPPGSLVMGLPAKIIRPLSDEERQSIRMWAEKYTHVAEAHKIREGYSS